MGAPADDRSFAALRGSLPASIVRVPVAPQPISATAIRAALARGAAGRAKWQVCFRRRFWHILNATNCIGPERMRLNRLQKTAVTALEDIKARDITLLDVRKLTSLYDTLIIATAESNRQVNALAQHVRDAMKAAGAPIVGVEGEEGGEWVLVDCAATSSCTSCNPRCAAYYNLEELWTPPAPRRRTKPTATVVA